MTGWSKERPLLAVKLVKPKIRRYMKKERERKLKEAMAAQLCSPTLVTLAGGKDDDRQIGRERR